MKQVIILIGLKGSGKTYIGTLMQEKLGIRFFRVEDIWLSLKSERFSTAYILEGMDLVTKEIDQLLLVEERIIIESTGITDHFRDFLEYLKSKYVVRLIKINTSLETCSRRVRSRDSSIHIPVSDDMLEHVNREALKVELDYDLIIENERTPDSQILADIHRVL